MTRDEKITYLMNEYIMTRDEALANMASPDGFFGPEPDLRPVTTTPAGIRRIVTMRRLRADDAPARYLRGRRQDAARNGYLGPLTRADLARITAGEFCTRDDCQIRHHTPHAGQ